jgi:hypothetical protein
MYAVYDRFLQFIGFRTTHVCNTTITEVIPPLHIGSVGCVVFFLSLHFKLLKNIPYFIPIGRQKVSEAGLIDRILSKIIP